MRRVKLPRHGTRAALVITTQSILNSFEAANLVTLDEAGWAIYPGHREVTKQEASVACVHCMVKQDPSLRKAFEMLLTTETIAVERDEPGKAWRPTENL